ncbi:cytochrome c, partial [Microbacteriaceae bacterium K1510]|nr:cytochrome c [Microbacteriaceae bacterium K1510]
MKRFPLLILAGLFVAALGACGPKPQTQPPATTTPPSTATPAPSTPSAGGTYDAATAETVFKNNCSSCHGQNLEGVVGPNLTKVGSKYTKDQILEILQKGKGQMPAGLVKGGDADTIA